MKLLVGKRNVVQQIVTIRECFRFMFEMQIILDMINIIRVEVQL